MSDLPKIDQPIYNIKVPSQKKEYKFRPFLVKEEKLLLIAKESGETGDVLSAIKQIVNNCSVDKKFDISKIALFDLEYLFLKLRSVSVDNSIKVAYKDSEDEKVYEFSVDLDKVDVTFPDEMDNNIPITENSGLVMKYPSAALYDDKEFLGSKEEQLFELIIRCIDSIYYEDQVYEAKDYKPEDLKEFIENLNIKTFEKVQKFLLNVPKIEYKIHYKNENGNKREILLSSLNDFFTWQ